jgi:DNA-binding PadR family transcriptional regulator
MCRIVAIGALLSVNSLSELITLNRSFVKKMADDLNNVSYVTLALIGDGGASPQDLVDMNRRGGQIYYSVAASRLYAEPKRLEQLGYVRSEKRPGKTRERTFYNLTPKGREALRRWIVEPPALIRVQNEAVPKLLAGDILDDDGALVETLLTLRSALDEQQAKIEEARAGLGSLPHRQRYLLLVIDLGERLIQAQRDWLDEVERELR